MKDSKNDIELTLRAAKLAKEALALVAVSDKSLALLMLHQVAVTLVETEKWLKSCVA